MASWGWRRGWNFRSNTGFTALGIVQCRSEEGGSTTGTDNDRPSDINGVVFRVTKDLLRDFDRRELGYDRIALPKEHLVFVAPAAPNHGPQQEVKLSIRDDDTVWVYVPQQMQLADEDHPILQSYVDTVCQGCLEWGGESMCREFVQLTHDWSPYFLNDTPSSRRPWLFRKEYTVIDRILQEHSDKTYVDQRKHPEEFATAFLLKLLRGSWGIPVRNPVFIGRDAELSNIHARLLSQRLSSPGCVAKLDVAGMGGVGKSQLVTEYCYRYFPSYYGLVVWLSAQSAESVASSYRQFMAETTNSSEIKDRDTDELISEVKTRLFRSKIPWLLVFDNLEDPSLLAKFVPHSSGCGHVLVTTRLLDTIDFGDQTLVLGCFQPEESLELFCRATKTVRASSATERRAAVELAELLGHLPLALGMAAAYMRRCDVTCEEYRTRYLLSPNNAAAHHLGGVSASLSLSLNAIQQENPSAWDALRLLAWLGPDQITKKMLRSLLLVKASQDLQRAPQHGVESSRDNLFPAHSVTFAAATVLGLGAIAVLVADSSRGRRVVPILLATSVVAAAATAIGVKSVHTSTSSKEHSPVVSTTLPVAVRRESQQSDVFVQSDLIWDILKSFSLLVVKEGQGSMHRLLGQALRASQSDEDCRRNLNVCVHTVQKAWTFKPERLDTWTESTSILEHAKAVLAHAVERQDGLSPDLAALSREVGVFSAMALNRFKEAQQSLELSLRILESIESTSPRPRGLIKRTRIPDHSASRAATLHELGRVFRYQGLFQESEDALTKALQMRTRVAQSNSSARHGVAATLYELGVLEVKKHKLDSAASFLQQALDLRRTLERESPGEDIEADCAASLHQLAAVHVAEKPPSLDLAESLLHEALSLSMQIGQRAATLKQLARVAIRRGDFDAAERSLAQALELYIELYGENSMHINVAAVKFQQGALAFQRDQLEAAWLHFSECLRARRQVYSYSQGNHLEVSAVLHELGCVALTQNRLPKALEMLTNEREILDQLYESSSSQQRERIYQARLTNLSWLRKCAKAQGDEDLARKLSNERTLLKRSVREEGSTSTVQSSAPPCKDGILHHKSPLFSIQQEALRCRLIARQHALALRSNGTPAQDQAAHSNEVHCALQSLSSELDRYRRSQRSDGAAHPLYDAIRTFHNRVNAAFSYDEGLKRSSIIEACDLLRDSFRDVGVQVSDSVQGKPKKASTSCRRGQPKSKGEKH